VRTAEQDNISAEQDNLGAKIDNIVAEQTNVTAEQGNITAKQNNINTEQVNIPCDTVETEGNVLVRKLHNCNNSRHISSRSGGDMNGARDIRHQTDLKGMKGVRLRTKNMGPPVNHRSLGENMGPPVNHRSLGEGWLEWLGKS